MAGIICSVSMFSCKFTDAIKSGNNRTELAKEAHSTVSH